MPDDEKRSAVRIIFEAWVGKIAADPDVRAGGQRLKRHLIEGTVGAAVLVFDLGLSFLIEIFVVHPLLHEVQLHNIAEAPWTEPAVTGLTGVFMVGMSALASIAAMRDIWKHMNVEETKHPEPVIQVNSEVPIVQPNRAARRNAQRKRH